MVAALAAPPAAPAAAPRAEPSAHAKRCAVIARGSREAFARFRLAGDQR